MAGVAQEELQRLPVLLLPGLGFKGSDKAATKGSFKGSFAVYGLRVYLTLSN